MSIEVANKMMALKDVIDDVHESGIEKGYSNGERYMWDAITNRNSKNRLTTYMFYEYPYEEFNPPYAIICKNYTAKSMFASAYKLKKIKKGTLDFGGKGCYSGSRTSTSSGLTMLFHNCTSLEEIEDIGLNEGSHYYTFGMCEKLRKIEKLCPRYDTIFTNAFTNCYALEEITFDGEIGRDINFLSCKKLNADSVKSIVTHLKDYTSESANQYKYTLTLNDETFNALEQADTTAEYNGEACTWAELVDNKKWNLVLY